MTNTSDQQMMQRVLELAEQGQNTTQPNPMVACIIVKEGEVIGEGYHQAAGELHAERIALDMAGERARGATAYVNLEPCCHQGRTPPCTDALIDAGISKVVAAMRDPNPLVEGGGYEVLKDAGINIESGVLEQAAIWLNRGFVQRMTHKKPWVMLKSAATLDGRTAAFDGKSQWITGEHARAEVQALRAKSSAIITGIDTVLADDPQMTVRLSDVSRQPLRVVLDSQLRLPLEARIIGDDQCCVVFTLSNDEVKIAQLTEMGVEVIQQTGQSQLDLTQVLHELAKWQCNQVLVEAGQRLSGAFLSANLVDELVVFYAGSVLGNQAKSMFEFNTALPLAKRLMFTVKDASMVGADVQIMAVNENSVQQLMAAASLPLT